MKSIICLISSNYSISFIYVILVYISSVPVLSTPSCGLYGSPPCQFVPAPPGQTPTCARPGKTYCEHVDNYPTYLIKHLVHKWGYEAKNLLIDETWDDFAAVAWHETPVFYDPSFIFPQRPYNGNAHNFGGYSYEMPSNGRGGGGKYSEGPYHLISKQQQQQQQTTETPTFLLYSAAAQQQRLNKNHVTPYTGSPKISPNNPTVWLKRVSRDLIRRNDTSTVADADEDANPAPYALPLGKDQEELKMASKRDTSLNMDLLEIVGVARPDINPARGKRQAPGRSSLCQTTSQFITPQAALNNKGNWMFVVNEANTARQMVKAELCASNTCSNLCQLPNGYNSRCEQKFVQKRLIALQANGQNLYTDTFWFPSCCVCTISAN